MTAYVYPKLFRPASDWPDPTVYRSRSISSHKLWMKRVGFEYVELVNADTIFFTHFIETIQDAFTDEWTAVFEEILAPSRGSFLVGAKNERDLVHMKLML